MAKQEIVYRGPVRISRHRLELAGGISADTFFAEAFGLAYYHRHLDAEIEIIIRADRDEIVDETKVEADGA